MASESPSRMPARSGGPSCRGVRWPLPVTSLLLPEGPGPGSAEAGRSRWRTSQPLFVLPACSGRAGRVPGRPCRPWPYPPVGTGNAPEDVPVSVAAGGDAVQAGVLGPGLCESEETCTFHRSVRACGGRGARFSGRFCSPADFVRHRLPDPVQHQLYVPPDPPVQPDGATRQHRRAPQRALPLQVPGRAGLASWCPPAPHAGPARPEPSVAVGLPATGEGFGGSSLPPTRERVCAAFETCLLSWRVQKDPGSVFLPPGDPSAFGA